MKLSNEIITKIEQSALEFILSSVREIHSRHPTESIYGAMFHCFYGDGENIYYPPISIGTEELLQKVVKRYQAFGSNDRVDKLFSDLRWSGADLDEYMFEEFDGVDGNIEEIADEVAKIASFFVNDDEWGKVYQEFLHCFPKACKQATQVLRKEGIVNDSFIAVATDEEGELIPLSMNQIELEAYFPEYA